MQKYSGNGRPFLYGVFSPSDREEALTVLERLSAAGHGVWFDGGGAKRAEDRRLRKAAASVLFISPEAVADGAFQAAVAAAVQGGGRIIAVYLRETSLDAGLSMLLGSTQGVMKYGQTEDDFYRGLLSSPALDGLEITAGQKAASKRTIIGACLFGAAALVLLIALLAGLAGGGRIDAGSRLGQLGLSGSADSIRAVYLYGENLLDHYRLSGGVTRVTEEGVAAGDRGRRIALAATGEEFPWGKLTDITDFAQLTNLEELCLAGNEVADISPLKGLKKLRMLDLTGMGPVDITSLPEFPALEVLNLTGCGFADNLDDPYDNTMYERSFNALLGCRTLKTVYVDSVMLEERIEEWEGGADKTSALARALEAGPLPFEVIVTDRRAGSFAELKAALEDKDACFITVTGDIDIPDGETLTIRPGVYLGGAGHDIVNRGTVELYGVWEMGLSGRVNYGTILIKSGGCYSGGMCGTENHGTFIIEKGGTAVLERGHQYAIKDGTFEIDGLFLIPNDGGSLELSGGDLVNNGRIVCYLTSGALYQRADGAVYDPAALPGTGSFEEFGELPHDHRAGS